VAYINYKERKLQLHYLDSKIKRELELCSYKLNCKNVQTDFVKKNKTKFSPFKLIKDQNVFMYFDLPISKSYYLKLSIPKSEYQKRVKKIDINIFENFLMEIVLIIISSFLFSLYVLRPLKKAYELNETFIKDILHDFNTPISSIKVNLYSLKKQNSSNKHIQRIEKNIQSILNLQKNLKAFLHSTPDTKESFNLKELIDEEIKTLTGLYPNIKVHNFLKNQKITTNKEAFRSIITNILSNAFKYNKKNGFVKIYTQNENLVIEDSGIGIKNPSKVFERFYKENERGIGIGMNIVKKLSDELGISVKIQSTPNIGTKVYLSLSSIKGEK